MIGFQRRKKGSGRSLMMASGIAVVVMVFGMAAQYWGSGRSRVHEVIEPNISSLLPAGAVVGVRMELPDSPQSARVVAYAVDGRESLALIAWGLDKSDFSIVSNVEYADMHMKAPITTTSLVAESIGFGAPTAVLARGQVDASFDIVSVFARIGDALRPVSLNDASGRSVPAQFQVGNTATTSTDVSFQDVDGDGDKDAVVVNADLQDGVVVHETREVFSWIDSAFFHDPELSKVMSMRTSLFPEPEAVVSDNQ